LPLSPLPPARHADAAFDYADIIARYFHDISCIVAVSMLRCLFFRQMLQAHAAAADFCRDAAIFDIFALRRFACLAMPLSIFAMPPLPY